MARGQSQAADNNLSTTNAVAGQEQDKANKLQSTLIPGYTSMMDSGFASPDEAAKDQSMIDTGYFSPADAGAATTSEMGAATAPFQSEEFRAGNTAAATRNASSLASQQDALALEQGQTAGGAAAELQKEKMANEESGLNTKIAGQNAGMYGLNQLEAGDNSAMESMYGLGPSTLNARAAGQSGDQEALGYINAATGAGGRIATGFGK